MKQSAAPPTKPGALGRGFNDPRAIRAILWAFIVAATVFSVPPLLRYFRGHTIFDYQLWYATGEHVLRGEEIYWASCLSQ